MENTLDSLEEQIEAARHGVANIQNLTGRNLPPRPSWYGPDERASETNLSAARTLGLL